MGELTRKEGGKGELETYKDIHNRTGRFIGRIITGYDPVTSGIRKKAVYGQTAPEVTKKTKPNIRPELLDLERGEIMSAQI